MTLKRPILYVDMDNVLVDFPSAFAHLPPSILEAYEHKDEIPNLFSLMEPFPDAITSLHQLAPYFDLYLLSTAPWENPSAWSDKLNWVKRYVPDLFYKRLILSHHKHLNKGDFLIDDRLANGADRFTGTFIHFGSEQFPDWQTVTSYLLHYIQTQ